MAKTAPTISQQNFKKMLSAGRTTVSKAVSRELKNAGMEPLLYKNRISQLQALKALKHLKEHDALGGSYRYTPPYKIIQATAKEQLIQDEAARTAVKQKHIRANIGLDIVDELARQELASGSSSSGSAGRGSRKGRLTLNEQLEQERRSREAAVENEAKKHQELLDAGVKRPQRSTLTNLPDMDID